MRANRFQNGIQHIWIYYICIYELSTHVASCEPINNGIILQYVLLPFPIDSILTLI